MKRIFISIIFALTLSLIAQPALAKSNVHVSGGGIITSGYGKDAPKITFGFNAFVDDNEQVNGHLEVTFHNTHNDEIDKGQFKSSNIEYFSIGTAEQYGVTGSFMSLKYVGEFNGEDGWSIAIRITDFGEPGRTKAEVGVPADAVRISLFNASSVNIYDTSDEIDYPHNQSWRTYLDGGNIKFHSSQ